MANKNCEVDILPKKKDEAEDDPYTTFNTMLDLDYDVDDVICQLKTLTKSEYIENIKDNKGQQRTYISGFLGFW